ncbi:MAG TPA: peptide chain release factor N(5)-glutamine methyltransferase [Arenimonas sp.]|nr:peptide chain release factor N(5)-glutamine methyltransferase [Arenimonas sp.]
MTDIASLLNDASSATGTALDRIDAECLLSHLLGRTRAWLYAFSDHQLTERQVGDFMALASRRAAGEPVAYITGRRGFWTFDLHVSPDTLIPRPETELLVDLALGRIPAQRPCRILDLGTGSGAIALALAHERPHAQVTAVDVSEAALAVAKRNALELELHNLTFAHGHWFTGLDGQLFDVIVSNPPYIEAADAHLQQGDLRFEPRAALASGDDGLDDMRIIVSEAPKHLRPGGWLLVEHGWDQGAAIRLLFGRAGFTEIATVQDLEQRDRVTLGQLAD